MVCVATHVMAKQRKMRSKFSRRAYQPGQERNAVGSNLQKLRVARGWSQEDLAGRCQRNGWDIDRVIIAKIESRIRAVTDWELKKLSEVIGVSPNELLGLLNK